MHLQELGQWRQNRVHLQTGIIFLRAQGTNENHQKLAIHWERRGCKRKKNSAFGTETRYAGAQDVLPPRLRVPVPLLP